MKKTASWVLYNEILYSKIVKEIVTFATFSRIFERAMKSEYIPNKGISNKRKKNYDDL